MDKLRVGIVGCGSIALDKHMPALALIEEVEMYAFYDIDQVRAREAALKFGGKSAKVYDDVDKLLSNKDIDVVHICTTSTTHADLTIRALEAGKHVMCEKPMATNVEEAKKMVEAAHRTGKKLTLGCQNRFRDDTQYLKRVCERGDLRRGLLCKGNGFAEAGGSQLAPGEQRRPGGRTPAGYRHTCA